MLKLKVDQKSGSWKKERKKEKEEEEDEKEEKKNKIIMRSVFLTKIGLSILHFFRGRTATNDERPSPRVLSPSPIPLVSPCPKRKIPPISLDYKISLDCIYKNDIL